LLVLSLWISNSIAYIDIVADCKLYNPLNLSLLYILDHLIFFRGRGFLMLVYNSSLHIVSCEWLFKCKHIATTFIFNNIQLDIADVTNFVHPGTPLDDEASQRGTSVYLVERRIDMLPKPLTEGKLFSSSSRLMSTLCYMKCLSFLWLIVLWCKAHSV
jgi:hypothetical protein